MSRKQGRECPVTVRRESLGISCSLDDTVRAEAVSLQVKPLLKTAVETGLAKQKGIQMEQATSSLSLGLRSCLQAATLIVPSWDAWHSSSAHLRRGHLRRQTDGQMGERRT